MRSLRRFVLLERKSKGGRLSYSLQLSIESDDGTIHTWVLDNFEDYKEALDSLEETLEREQAATGIEPMELDP